MIGIVGDIVPGRSMREFRRDCWNHAGTDVAESVVLAYLTPTCCRVVSFFLDMANFSCILFPFGIFSFRCFSYLISVFVHRLVYPGHKSIAWEFGVAYEQCRCPLISCNRTMGLDGLKGYILFPSNLVLPFRLTPNSALDAVVSPFTHSTSGPDSLQSNQYLPHRHLQPPADGSRPAVETRLPDSCVTDAD